MPHIASTLTCDTRYTHFSRGADGQLTEGKSVTVKGGFGLANKQFVTPTGAVLTQVSDEEMAILESHQQFKDHVKGGFLSVVKGTPDGDKAAANMNIRDKSQPLNPSMYAEKSAEQPETLTVSTGKAKA